MPRSYETVVPKNIICAMRYAISDKAFLVGNEVISRVDGWPMGGHMSAAATAITVEHDVADIYRNRARAKELGWHCGKLPTQQVIQGIVHIDDALVFSKKTLCHDCLKNGILRCFPQDIGMTIEQQNPQLTFLHVTLDVKDSIEECPIDFSPSAPNSDYSRGVSDYPKVARVPPFLGPSTKTRDMLRPFLASKFAAFWQIYAYDVSLLREPLAILLSEIMREGWPPKQVAKCMMTVGLNVRCPFKKVFMLLATALKKYTHVEDPKDSFKQLLTVIGDTIESYLRSLG